MEESYIKYKPDVCAWPDVILLKPASGPDPACFFKFLKPKKPVLFGLTVTTLQEDSRYRENFVLSFTMSDDLLAGCGALTCLVIIGVSLFFAMYFGNAFSIPGVIVLLIIGIVVIVGLVRMLGESQQEATANRTAFNMMKDENRRLRTRIDQQEQEKRKKEEEKRKMEEQSWCRVM